MYTGEYDAARALCELAVRDVCGKPTRAIRRLSNSHVRSLLLAAGIAGLPARVGDVFATVAATLTSSAVPEFSVSAHRRRMSVVAGSTSGAVEDDAVRAVELAHSVFAARCLGAETSSPETVWSEKRVAGAAESSTSSAAAGKRVGAQLIARCA